VNQPPHRSALPSADLASRRAVCQFPAIPGLGNCNPGRASRSGAIHTPSAHIHSALSKDVGECPLRA